MAIYNIFTQGRPISGGEVWRANFIQIGSCKDAVDAYHALAIAKRRFPLQANLLAVEKDDA